MCTEFYPEDLKVGLRVDTIFILKGFYIFHSVPYNSITLTQLCAIVGLNCNNLYASV